MKHLLKRLDIRATITSKRKLTIDIRSREGFGSFHSKDIEDLIRAPPNSFEIPDEYDEISGKTDLEHISLQTGFGMHLKSTLFCIDHEWTFLNHGAFGCTTAPLLRESHRWRNLCETQPLRFFDRLLMPLIANSVREISKYIGCPSDELLPLPNVTTGINSVINSISLNPGDEILCFSITYGSTKKILKDLCERKRCKYKEVHLSIPLTREAILSSLKASLNETVKIVIIDQITSNTAAALPVSEMARFSKAAGAIVIVDAAHALTAQDICIYDHINESSSIGHCGDIDVWLTNGHKWFCAPKGCAFMWVAPNLHRSLRPIIISHGYSLAHENSRLNLLSGFAWDGCRDYSALVTVPSGIRFWKDNADRFRKYNRTLLEDVRSLIMEEWKVPSTSFHAAELRLDSPMLLVC